MGISSIGGTTNFGKLEQASLEQGPIGVKEAEDLGKAAASDPQLARQALEQDQFESPKARAAFAKAAHLTGADQKVQANPLLGKAVGGATITRTLGDPKGYENPLQAVAAARLTGVKNAAVVKQGDRFVAVELNKSAPGLQKSDGSLSPAIGLLPKDDGAIAAARKKLTDARKNPEGQDLNQLQLDLASKMYGLPPSSFNLTNRSEGRVATTVDKNGMPQGINIQNGLMKASNGDAGTHAQVGTEGDKAKGFDPTVGTAITIDGGVLEGTTKNPTIDNALGVFDHESTHLEDTEEAKKLITRWGGDFKADPDKFKGWLNSEEKKGNVTHAQAMRVGQVIDPNKGNADSELHAHMATAIDAIRNGAPEVAKEQMKDYLSSAQNPDLLVENHVLAEASKAFKSMTKEQQTQFKEALKQAGDVFKNFDPEKGTYLRKKIEDR